MLKSSSVEALREALQRRPHICCTRSSHGCVMVCVVVCECRAYGCADPAACQGLHQQRWSTLRPFGGNVLCRFYSISWNSFDSAFLLVVSLETASNQNEMRNPARQKIYCKRTRRPENHQANKNLTLQSKELLNNIWVQL